MNTKFKPLAKLLAPVALAANLASCGAEAEKKLEQVSPKLAPSPISLSHSSFVTREVPQVGLGVFDSRTSTTLQKLISNPSAILKFNDQGEDVKTLQILLSGTSNLILGKKGADGDFGKNTAQAVERFQEKTFRLGIVDFKKVTVGENTLFSLALQNAEVQKPEITHNRLFASAKYITQHFNQRDNKVIGILNIQEGAPGHQQQKNLLLALQTIINGLNLTSNIEEDGAAGQETRLALTNIKRQLGLGDDGSKLTSSEWVVMCTALFAQPSAVTEYHQKSEVNSVNLPQ